MKHTPPLILILFTFLFFSFSSTYADDLYVLKNVKVHTEASLESPVTKLLLGGEKVNVLSINGDFTEIEDNSKKVGWVASGFLTTVEPKKPIKTLSSTKPPEKSKVQPKQKKQITSSKKVISKAPPKKQKVKQKVKVSKKLNIDLQKQNKLLLKQLNKIRQIIKIPSIENQIIEQKPADKEDISKTNSAFNLFGYEVSNPNIIIWAILITLIIGFILGLLWSDFRQRRKHGGFKV